MRFPDFLSIIHLTLATYQQDRGQRTEDECDPNGAVSKCLIQVHLPSLVHRVRSKGALPAQKKTDAYYMVRGNRQIKL